MGILLNILSCEIVVFASICTVWILSLVECGQNNQSILCYSTWGKHPVNIGVGTATLLVSVSVFFSILVVYKQNIDHQSFLLKCVEIFLTCYSILIRVIIKTKLGQYTQDCIANFGILWTSNIPEYLFFFILMFSHFAVAICLLEESVLRSRNQFLGQKSPPIHRRSYGHPAFNCFSSDSHIHLCVESYQLVSG